MSTPASRPAGLTQWVRDHPRPLGVLLLVVGVLWIVADVREHRLDRVTFGVIYALGGLFWLGHTTLRVQPDGIRLPKRVWGARTIAAGDIAAVEIPASVWSAGGCHLVLRDGERVLLPRLAADSARTVAADLGLPVVPSRE